MGLETGTYISDLVQSNPAGGDNESQGDDHLRLIKTVAQQTLPNASRAKYFPQSGATKTSNFSTTIPGDDDKTFQCDATSGNITVTMTAPSSPNDGIIHRFFKIDSSVNTVILTPASSKLINGAATFTLNKQWEGITCIWLQTYGAWLALPAFNLATLPYYPGRQAVDGTFLSVADGGTGLGTAQGEHERISLHGSDIASASTVNLDTATGFIVDITGTTTITGFTLSDGKWRIVRFTGALTLTNNGSIILPGGANITTAAGDKAIIVGYSGNVVRVFYEKATGKAVVTAVTTADFPAGTIIQRTFTTYTTNADLSTTIPVDDTIPQSSEGTQVISQSITPRDTNSRLRLRFSCMYSIGSGANMTAAFFQDSNANAIFAASDRPAAVNVAYNFEMEWEYAPATASSLTIKVNVGANSGNVRLNGTASGRLFGGVAAATLVIEEIAG